VSVRTFVIPIYYGSGSGSGSDFLVRYGSYGSGSTTLFKRVEIPVLYRSKHCFRTGTIIIPSHSFTYLVRPRETALLDMLRLFLNWTFVTFNRHNEDLPGNWEPSSKGVRWEEEGASLTKPYRYMFQQMREKAAVLDETICRMEDNLRDKFAFGYVSYQCCGSGTGIRCLFDPGSGIRNRFLSGSRIPTHIFDSLH
jgi:hypothetical protein